MIKAQDLRIGNIVNRNGNPIVVKDIAKSGINMTIDTMGHCDQNYWTLWSEIEPIPLTEEWLVKFGAKGRDGAYMSYTIGELELCNDGGHKYFYGNSGPIGMPLLYVHQFQNAYFALTGEELTVK